MAAFEWSQPFPIYQKGFKLCQEITHSDDGLHDLQFADTRMITYRAPVRAKNEKSNFSHFLNGWAQEGCVYLEGTLVA